MPSQKSPHRRFPTRTTKSNPTPALSGEPRTHGTYDGDLQVPVRSLRRTMKPPDVGSAHSPSRRRLRLGCFAGCVGSRSAWARTGVLSSQNLMFLKEASGYKLPCTGCVWYLLSSRSRISSSSSRCIFRCPARAGAQSPEKPRTKPGPAAAINWLTGEAFCFLRTTHVA